MLFSNAGQPPVAKLPVSKHQFIVIAHRGSHLVKPENTLEAIEAAIAAGADYVEADLRTTKDGHLVLCHDKSVDRTTDGKGLVKDLSSSEIFKLTTTGNDKMVCRVPDFESVLKVCKDRINIYLDFKDADVPQTYRMLKQAGMEHHVVVYLNKAEQYAAWRQTDPSIPLMGSLPDTVDTKEKFDRFSEKIRLQVLDNAADSLFVNDLKAAGISVWLDVQGADESPEKWMNAMNKGIQGMQTDHPEALVKYLQQNNLRNGIKSSFVK